MKENWVHFKPKIHLPLPGVSRMLSCGLPIFTIVSQELASARCIWSLILVMFWFLVNDSTCTGSQFDSETLSDGASSWVDCSTELSYLWSLNLWFAMRPIRFWQTSSSPRETTVLPPRRSAMLLPTGLARASSKCVLLTSLLGRYVTFLDVTV